MLVVETVDAYWLIEDPTFDSLAPTASADELAGGAEFGVSLPSSVAPTAADGRLLTATEADLTWSLLSDLWFDEPDFFYEDVLAVTFYSDTSMDSLIDSGLFDGGDEAGWFNDSDLFADEFLDDATFTNNDDDSASFGELFTASEESTTASDSATSAALNVDIEVGESEGSDLLASAKAEIASWSRRLEAESMASNGVARTAAVENWFASAAPLREVVAGVAIGASARAMELNRSSPDLVDSAVVASGTATNETVVAREMTNRELLFARFPSLLGVVSGRSTMLQLIRGERVRATDAQPVNDPTTDDAVGSLSYSQWASLLGVTSLTAASLWRSGKSDHDETESQTPLRIKSRSKRPVAC